MRLCCRWVLTCIYTVDGNAITYDASGNPTSYYNGYTMTWVEGRKLDTVTVNGQTYTYVYNSDGQRVKKINPDGSYIEYYVMDGTTVGESHFTATGNKTLGIRYTLDECSNVIGFTTGGQSYYFAKNLQGDVLAVYNASTNELAAQYTYDSWGNILSATGTLEEINPFRYRGYYYDEETNFYYLQSRYYDAAIGRFINADVYSSTGQGLLGHNMFAYCRNNPVCMVDFDGKDAIYVVDFKPGRGLPYFGHAYAYIQDGKGDWHITHFAGQIPDKSTARVVCDKVDDISEINKIKKGKRIDYILYVYLPGDFTDSLAMAKEHEGSNYGGYNLLVNNCLVYVQDVLLEGKFDRPDERTVLSQYLRGYTPYGMYHELKMVQLDYALKGWIKRGWKSFKSLF